MVGRNLSTGIRNGTITTIRSKTTTTIATMRRVRFMTISNAAGLVTDRERGNGSTERRQVTPLETKRLDSFRGRVVYQRSFLHSLPLEAVVRLLAGITFVLFCVNGTRRPEIG
jgi:hypothetical protein